MFKIIVLIIILVLLGIGFFGLLKSNEDFKKPRYVYLINNNNDIQKLTLQNNQLETIENGVKT